MTYETYRLIFLGGAAAAVIMLIVTVILFIRLHILSVIGYLSGATASKEIRQMQTQNRGSTTQNLGHSSMTDKISRSGRIMGKTSARLAEKREAEAAEETELLVSEETTLLDDAPAEETTLLAPAGGPEAPGDDRFEIEYDITFLHTDERIPG